MLLVSKLLRRSRYLYPNQTKFCRKKVISNRSFSSNVSNSSGSQNETAPTASGGILAFLDANLQQIANAIGIFAFVSCCNYNFKIKHAWEQKESEEEQYSKEIDEIGQKLLLDPAWIAEVEEKIRSSTEVGILQAAVTEKIARNESKTNFKI